MRFRELKQEKNRDTRFGGRKSGRSAYSYFRDTDLQAVLQIPHIRRSGETADLTIKKRSDLCFDQISAKMDAEAFTRAVTGGEGKITRVYDIRRVRIVFYHSLFSAS